MRVITFRELANERKVKPQTIRSACKRYGIEWTLAPIVGPGRRQVGLVPEVAARFTVEWDKEHGK